MATFSNQTKNSSTYSNDTKHSSTFSRFLRHGKEPLLDLEGLADYTFPSVVFDDGTVLENLTFEQLVDIVWTNQTKN